MGKTIGPRTLVGMMNVGLTNKKKTDKHEKTLSKVLKRAKMNVTVVKKLRICWRKIGKTQLGGT